MTFRLGRILRRKD